jgi:hypothetical protein
MSMLTKETFLIINHKRQELLAVEKILFDLIRKYYHVLIIGNTN